MTEVLQQELGLFAKIGAIALGSYQKLVALVPV